MRVIMNIITAFLFSACSHGGDVYRGDGTLTRSFGVKGTPIYNVQMPEIDISHPNNIKYDLTGLPSSKVPYFVSLVIPVTTYLKPEDREGWGWGRFEIRRNGVSQGISESKFSLMSNAWGKYNRLYMMENTPPFKGIEFEVLSALDKWEIVFECSGCETPSPILTHIQVHSGGK